jgi:hypothetical protein
VAQFTNFLGAMPSSGAERRDQRRNASDLTSQGGGKSTEDRYYTPEEYRKFTNKEKAALYEKRLKTRKGKSGDGGGKGGKRPRNDNYDKMNKAVKKQGRQIAQLLSQGEEPSNEEDDAASESAETEPASNRTNPALTRRPRRRPGRTEA